MTAASVNPETASTAKSTSSNTALMNDVLAANGPDPRAVASVAMVAIRSTDSALPATPKLMAAQVTNGSTANARMCSRTGKERPVAKNDEADGRDERHQRHGTR